MFRAKRNPLVLLLFVGTVCLVSASGVLGAMIEQTIEQLSGNSNQIVRGDVIDMQSQWNSSHTIIYTTVVVRVSETLKGNLKIAEELTVFVPGGQVGDTGLAVEHAPQFQLDEEVLLFLNDSRGAVEVTSWEQGKYTIENGRVLEKQVAVTEFIRQIEAAER